MISMISFRRTSSLLDYTSSSMDLGGTNLKYNTVLAKRAMANVRIIIPTPLRQYAGNRDAVEVEAASVHDALVDLVERHDQLRRHLFSEDGRLRNFVNFDVIDESNLQRQVLYSTKDVGRKKLEVAKERVAQINPNVDVQTYETRLTSDNALDILKDYDVVIDGTDNFPTRYLVNDASVLLHKPNVYGSIFRFEGQASVFDARKGPCYRCLYSDPPPPGLVPSCAEGGVLGVLPGIIGSIQAIETLKLLLGKEDTLIGRLLVFDALRMKFRELQLREYTELR